MAAFPLFVVSGAVLIALVGPGCSDSTAAPPRPTAAATEPEELVRIYDFSPASTVNPIVARVVDTPIAISMGDFRAFLATELSEAERADLDPKAKRRHLERLIDELVLLWDAYRQKVDERDPIAGALAGTRQMLLAELLIRAEVGGKAKSAEEYAALLTALEDRLFEKAEVIVSNEAYAALKEAVARHSSGDLEKLAADLAERPLAKCGDFEVAIGDVFAMYVGLAPGKRPDIAKPETLSELLKELLLDGLKLVEARTRGIDKSRLYREMVAANRASLTRMWLQDRISDEAMEQMEAPDTEARIRRWYDERRESRYVYKDEQRGMKSMSFEAAAPSIQSDYFDLLRERFRAARVRRLRDGLKVEVDDRLAEGA